ncbi:hypothetical protein BH09SUM1_BH09SUM1_21440 [soil metagenome]
MKPWIVLLLLALFVAPIRAEEQKPAPLDRKWLAVFEQSYGVEGMYVIEAKPTDEGAASRMSLQLLNAAAQELRAKDPKAIISYEALQKAGLVQNVKPAKDEQFLWDAKVGIFTSSLGGGHTPEAGVRMLLHANESIRRRTLDPDAFTRQRWKKIYSDASAPDLLKREIILREFLLDHQNPPEALEMADAQQAIKMVADAVAVYTLQNKVEAGTAIEMQTLREAGLIPEKRVMKTPIEFQPIIAGKAPVALVHGREISGDEKVVEKLRRENAERQLRKFPDFPPAMVLAARYLEEDEAIKLSNRAVETWPDVPGVRIGRMCQYARKRDFKGWTPDLDYLLTRFPAAPILVDIELAGEYGQLSAAPGVAPQIAMLLADVRPDLLTHQLWAIQILEGANRMADAKSIYDRLVFANPAWKTVVKEPVVTMAVMPTPAAP